MGTGANTGNIIATCYDKEGELYKTFPVTTSSPAIPNNLSDMLTAFGGIAATDVEKVTIGNGITSIANGTAGTSGAFYG